MMNHKDFHSFPALVLCFVFFCLFAFTAIGAPVISGIQPTRVVPGELVAIVGSDLTGNIELRSPTGAFQITGTVNQAKTEVSFQIPANVPAGEYTVAMIAQSGTYFSDTELKVVAGGPPFKTGPTISIPTEGLPGFGQLIAMIFTWSLSILGIVVFVMIFYAGFKWFTAAGNTAKVNDAKDQITNAITGAIILLSAWIILYTINPDLVGGEFTLPGVGTQQTP